MDLFCYKCRHPTNFLIVVEGAIGRFKKQCRWCSTNSRHKQKVANRLIRNEEIRERANFFEPALYTLIKPISED